MRELIRKTLDHCGYTEDEATEENLFSCFLDYVDNGIFNELDFEEAKDLIDSGEISLKTVCYNLLKR